MVEFLRLWIRLERSSVRKRENLKRLCFWTKEIFKAVWSRTLQAFLGEFRNFVCRLWLPRPADYYWQETGMILIKTIGSPSLFLSFTLWRGVAVNTHGRSIGRVGSTDNVGVEEHWNSKGLAEGNCGAEHDTAHAAKRAWKGTRDASGAGGSAHCVWKQVLELKRNSPTSCLSSEELTAAQSTPSATK